MSPTTLRLFVPLLAALVSLPSAGLAQDVKVNTPGARVRVGPDGVDVSTRGAKVKTGPKGVRVKAGAGRVHVGKKGGKKRGKVVCKGNETRTLRGVVIKAAGPAVRAHGNCDLTLVDATIVAKKGVAIRAGGNADVKLRRCTIKGRKAALVVTDSATVKLKGSTVAGKVRVDTNADLIKQGGNRFSKR